MQVVKIDYVGAAYALFALVLAWDYLAPRLRLARFKRDRVLRSRRDQARRDAAGNRP